MNVIAGELEDVGSGGGKKQLKKSIEILGRKTGANLKKVQEGREKEVANSYQQQAERLADPSATSVASPARAMTGFVVALCI